MTRAQIINAGQRLLNEIPGNPAFEAQDTWNDQIDLVTDEIARLGDIWTSPTYNIVADQAFYKLPYVNQSAIVTAYSQGGYPYVCRTLTEQEMDKEIYGWRQNPQAGTFPRFAIILGAQTIRLWPVPNYDAEGGLRIAGISFPSCGTEAGQSLWPNPQDECPLVPQAHMVVVRGAMAERCLQFDNYASRATALMQRYQSLKDQVGSDLQNQTDANRFGDASSYTGLTQIGWGN
jgi:hypothetical protein